MGKTGTKTSMQQRIAAPKAKARPFRPPPGTSASAAALWKKIVAAYPEDYFRVGDMPLLLAYCQEYERCQRAQKRLEEEGEVIETERGPKRNPWHVVLTASEAALAQMATKLRICANSRTTHEKAADYGLVDITPEAKTRAGLMFTGDRKETE